MLRPGHRSGYAEQVARRKNKYQRPFRPVFASTTPTSSHKADGLWVVRPIRAANAQKSYLCPECNQTIPVGMAHVVAWPHQPPLGATSGVDYRRHFHSACWDRKR